jgi:antibiotic biosynthesis monooxygenase (ABM) superfamily enzyme
VPDKDTEITTDHDEHQERHKAMLMFLIWLSVYPIVTAMTYLTSGWDVPNWVRTLVTTALTVPTITYLVVPNAKTLIKRADHKG